MPRGIGDVAPVRVGESQVVTRPPYPDPCPIGSGPFTGGTGAVCVRGTRHSTRCAGSNADHRRVDA